MFLHRFGKARAPEFPPDSLWMQGDPLTMKSLEGKVVLLYFWTYSCVNCLRTLPFIQKWHETYGKNGLVVIGIHTPEFAFEKEESFLKKEVERLGMTYTILRDNEYKVWNLYGNRWWPRTFLVNHQGHIVYDHIGEGGYQKTEQAIQFALADIGVEKFPKILAEAGSGHGRCKKSTPELYGGFARGIFGNAQNVLPNMEQAYTDKKEYEDDVLYIHGHWKMKNEALIHTKTVATFSEYVAFRYHAFSVYAVLGSNSGRGSVCEVEIDGMPLPEDMRGEDIRMKDGKTIVRVKHPRVYQLIDSDLYHKGVLTFRVKEAGVEIYAFTFGECEGL